MSELRASAALKNSPAGNLNPAPSLADYILIAPTAIDAKGRIVSLTVTSRGDGAETDCVRLDGAPAQRAWDLIRSISRRATG